MWPLPFLQTLSFTQFYFYFIPLLNDAPHSLALIGQAVSEKVFEYDGHIHIYCPWIGADNPLGKNVFIYIKILSICIVLARFPNLIKFYYFPPIKCICDLTWPCRKIGQGHPRVMILVYKLCKLHCLILHAKFQNHRPSVSGEEEF